MIVIGIGANLESPEYGPPRATCGAALAALEGQGYARIKAVSRWYESAPVPMSDQPWYVNGVAEVSTDLSPEALVDVLLSVEEGFGRVRSVPNAARRIDLDLIAYGDFRSEPDADIRVPHPRLGDRAFVLLPLRDLAPQWRHPVTGISLADMIDRLPPNQEIRPMPPAQGRFGTEFEPQTALKTGA